MLQNIFNYCIKEIINVILKIFQIIRYILIKLRVQVLQMSDACQPIVVLLLDQIGMITLVLFLVLMID